jgi:hypothetical protein
MSGSVGNVMNDEQRAIAQISRDLIAGLAPAELPMFRANSAAYFADAERALAPVTNRDEMLGFGAGDAARFLTPVVMLLVTTAVNFVIAEVKKSVRTEAASLIASWFKALAAPLTASTSTTKAAEPSPLSREQIDRLRAIAVEKARLYVDADQANRLADELVGRFVTS